MHITGYGSKGFYGTPASQAYASGGANAQATKTGGQRDAGAATVVSLSDAARAATAEPDFAAVIVTARETLNRLLAETDRASPLEGGVLALDMGSLSQRELHAIAATGDGLFTGEERKAAQLEMDRRFDLALSGPAAVSELTGDYRALYKAAATYLDGLSTEQRAEPGWQAARTALDKALAALDGDRASPPKGIANDPVASWLAARKDKKEGDGDAALAGNLRTILDKRYEAGETQRRKPDLSQFNSRAVSAVALNRDGLFSADEVGAAKAEIRARANAALSEGYKDAGRSGDPTAFARNIMAIYSAMSADERQAAGFSDALLDTAVSSYQSTMRLMDMMATSMNVGGAAGWFAR